MPPLFTHHAHNCASASSSTSRANGEVATNPKIFDHDWDKDDGYDQYSSLISTHADTIRSVGSKKNIRSAASSACPPLIIPMIAPMQTVSYFSGFLGCVLFYVGC